MHQLRDDIQVRYYVVGLIDLQGQSGELAKWGNPLGVNGQSLEFVTRIQKTAGTIMASRREIRRQFQDLSCTQMASAKSTRRLPDVQNALMEITNTCNVTIQQFSDTFVFYAPVAVSETEISTLPLLHILLACSSTMLNSLANRSPVRGGISVGLGIDDPELEGFYGPALATASYLESKKASYPRIVTCPKVMDMANLNTYCNHAQKNEIYLAIAKQCKNLMIRQGKCAMLDFIGNEIRNLSDLDFGKTQESVKQAHRFVSSELERFQACGNKKLAPRYERLLKYINSRMHLWGLTPTPQR